MTDHVRVVQRLRNYLNLMYLENCKLLFSLTNHIPSWNFFYFYFLINHTQKETFCLHINSFRNPYEYMNIKTKSNHWIICISFGFYRMWSKVKCNLMLLKISASHSTGSSKTISCLPSSIVGPVESTNTGAFTRRLHSVRLCLLVCRLFTWTITNYLLQSFLKASNSTFVS